jgi:TetR/AcrR family transcriptional regulator, fatty acid metabolism regulator protein
MTSDIILSDADWPYTKAKTAVLSAAAAVIREEGPRAATLKNIASRAGITEPAIFRHFDGVDGLFAGLFHVFERIHQRFDDAYRAEGKGIVRLRAAIRSIVDHLAASHDFAYIVIHARQVFREYPELREKIAELSAKDYKNALACIEEGVKAGEIRSDVDPASIAVSLMGGVYMIAILWIESGYAFDLRQVCGDRWEDVERLFASKPSPRPRETKDSAASKARFAAIFSLKPSRASKPPKAAKASKASKGAKASKTAKPSAGKAGSGAKKPRPKAGKAAAAKTAAPRKSAAKPAAPRKQK